MWEYLVIISTCISIVFIFIIVIVGIIYYINNKRIWEAEELTKLIRSDVDSSMLISIKRNDPTEDINECEDSEKSCAREIKSYKGQCKMVTQNDGNLVLYDARKNAIWSSNTQNKGNGPYKTKVEENGNYVLYDANENKIWETGKINKGTPPYRFSFKSENPCNAVIFDKNNKVMWSSHQTNFENKYIKNIDSNRELIKFDENIYFFNTPIKNSNYVTFMEILGKDAKQKWTLTPEGNLIHESGKCLEGNPGLIKKTSEGKETEIPYNEMEGYLKILEIRLGKLDEKMSDEQKKEMKQQLDEFGKGDLTDANDIINRIKNIHTIKMNDCQNDNPNQKWMYDPYGSNIRNTRTNWCLGELSTVKNWKNKDGNDISYEGFNIGIFPCNSEGFKKKLVFE